MSLSGTKFKINSLLLIYYSLLITHYSYLIHFFQGNILGDLVALFLFIGFFFFTQ